MAQQVTWNSSMKWNSFDTDNIDSWLKQIAKLTLCILNFKWNSIFRVEQELFKCKNTKISQIISTKDTESHANVNQLPELDALRCKEIDGKSQVDQRSRPILQPVRSKTNGTKNNTKERQMNVLKSQISYESKKMISRLAEEKD